MKLRSALSLALLLPLAAMANITPTGNAISGVVGGPFTWSYQLNLSAEADAITGLSPASNPVPHTDLNYGAFITIYDFAGYIAGTCTAPAGWTCTSQNVGFTPDDVLPQDDPTVPNLTWAHTTGAVISGQPTGVDLGIFSAQSLYNEIAQVSYT